MGREDPAKGVGVQEGENPWHEIAQVTRGLAQREGLIPSTCVAKACTTAGIATARTLANAPAKDTNYLLQRVFATSSGACMLRQSMQHAETRGR